MSTDALEATPLAPEIVWDYWEQSKSPLASLLFVAPMIIGYELGVLWLGTHGLRSGAAVWMQEAVSQLGLAGWCMPPLLAIAALLAWHHATGRCWRVSSYVLGGMLCEAIAMAAALVLAARAQMMLLSATVEVLPTADVAPSLLAGQAWQRVVLYLGAGLYEELLFRLALMPLIAWVLISVVGVRRSAAWFTAALASSFCFAAAHYLGAHGDAFAWPSFAVRFVAGGFFAALFVLRGFGIAAGAHAGYDIWVGCLA